MPWGLFAVTTCMDGKLLLGYFLPGFGVTPAAASIPLASLEYCPAGSRSRYFCRASAQPAGRMSFGVDRGLCCQALAFVEVERGARGINGNGFVRRFYLGDGIAGLKEQDGLVAQVKGGLSGVSADGPVVSCLSLRYVVGVNVNLTQTALADAVNFGAVFAIGAGRGFGDTD